MPYWSARSAARWSEMSIVSRIGKPAGGALRDDRVADLAAERVDPLELLAGAAAQVLVVALLHTGLADPVARAGNVRLLRPGGLAGLVVLLVDDELARRDLPDVAEHVGEQRLGVVLAQVGRA